jgi:hypothetical protein
MNAVNFIDGLDGLVAGVALIANAVFFVYTYLVARDTGASSYSSLASFIAVALIGVCIGFLPSTGARRSCSWATPARCCGLLMASSAIVFTGNLPLRCWATTTCSGARSFSARSSRSCCPWSSCCCRCSISAWRRPADGARQVAVLARSQAPAPPHARYGAQRP